MNAIHEQIESIASAVMMADGDPDSDLPAIGDNLAEIGSQLLPEHPQAAELATGLSRVTSAVQTDDHTLDTLVAGIGLLQRLYASSERGAEQIDDPGLYDRIVDPGKSKSIDATAPAVLRTDLRGVDEEAFSYFTEEAEEHLGNAEAILLLLEKNPEDETQVETLFRIFHTLKGAAGYANLSDVVHLTHSLESILDAIRSGQMQIQRQIIEVGLESVDLLRSLIAHVQNTLDGQQSTEPELAPLMQRIAALTSQCPSPQTENAPAAPADFDGNSAVPSETDTDNQDSVPTEESGEIAMDRPPEENEIATEIAETVEEPAASAQLTAIIHVAAAVRGLNLDDLSTLGVLNGELEQLAAELAAETPIASVLSIALAKILEKLILDECAAAEAMDLMSYGSDMLHRLRLDFEQNGSETLDDQALFEQITTLAEVDADSAITADAEALSPEAQIATGGDFTENDLLAEDEEEEEDVAPPVEVDQEIFGDFSSEAEEHLNAAESALISLEGHPDDDELLNTIFRAFHTIKGAASFLNLNDVTRVSHAVEDVLDSARKKQLELNQAITDVILEAIDLLKELMQNVETQIESGEVYPRNVVAFVKKVAYVASHKDIPAPAETPVNADEPTDAPATNGAPVAQPAAAPAAAKQQANSAKHRDQHVRVGTEKLDALVDIVGELIIAQTQVSQNPDVLGTENQKLVKDISQLMKISSNLQEITMSMRMVPIRATFERMARMVRDLARKCDKSVEFTTSGEDTELDKNVVEEIVDPLTHMIRNSVDHGVEPSEKRLTAGKSEKGHVSLHAYHKGGNFVIELRDDGNGINREKVLQKAIDRGLVQPDEQLSDEQINNLVFHPGLSTAEKITDVSGRGVGMDVVRRNIENLRGKVDVQSEPGKGSVFTIKLPLTMAIIDGMIIGIGQERYILQLTSIISSLRPLPEQICTVMGQGEMVKVQDELYPLVRLHERFNVTARHTNPWEGLVMLIEAEGERCCLLVDELIGLQQVVIKGLDEELRQDPCLSGCAILGDGRIGLILDANGLVTEELDSRAVAYK